MATVRLQLRRGLADDWFDANPTLAAGEIGIETDTNTFKFGDGTTPWNSLEYALSGTVDDYILLSSKGVAGGVASLDGSGLIPLSQLPGAAALDAEVSSAISTHNDDTTSVHGIADTAALATKNYADNAVSTHEADTTSVHGIADTAALATKNYADNAVSTHEADTTSVHGIADTAALATKNYADAAVSTHNDDTTSVHGIADTSILVTTTGSQTLVSKSLTSPALTGTPTAPTASAGTDTTQIATTAFVQDAIELVVGVAPAALDTLAEIATSLNNDADLSGSLTTSISGKVAKSGDTMSGELNMGSNKITSLGTPTALSDAATKSYVDAGLTNSVASHASVTENVHGITNTANLVYTNDTRLSDERVPQPASVTTGKIADLAVTEGKINDSAVTSAKIQDGAVTTAKVLDDAITSEKIADNAIAQSHLSDNSVGSNEIIEFAVTTAKIADVNITTGKIADSAVTAAKIEDSAVTSVKINTDAVTSIKIAADAITTAKIADLNITTGKIADSAVTTDKLNNSAVTEDKISSLAVTEGKIADGAVSSVKIADSAVTSDKIADGTIVNSNISSSAAIATSKIDGLDTALSAKLSSTTAASTYAPIADPTFTGTVAGVTKSHVGLGNVDNTSDANKPVSTATQTALNLKANLEGPTFTGTVVLPSTTSIGNVSATELGYVDGVTSAIQTQIDAKLSKSGGTMTGDLTLAGAPTSDLHAATKAYVDNVSAGINFHQPVRVATTANITLSGTQTIDGVSVVAGDRVLVKDQTDQKTNGIYVVASGSWSRATDADNNPTGELAGGDFSLVLEGTVNSGYGYVCSNTSAITIGTTNVTYAAFNAAKAVTAGSGLTESTPGTLDIATGGVTSAMIADGAIVDADINASAAIAQSKISGLSSSLALKANLAAPSFTGGVTVDSSGITFADGAQTKQGVPSLTVIASATTGAYNLSTGGLALRDQLIPIGGTHDITVPTNATTAFPVGTSISFYQSAGTGGRIVPVDGTVTILSTPGSTLRTTNSSATITKVATNTWLLAGDLKA